MSQKGSGESKNLAKIQARDPCTVQDKEISEEHRTANPKVAVYATGARGGTEIFNWGVFPRNHCDGPPGSE